MAGSIARMRSLGAASQLRAFSASARRNAAEVKSLGVIGAGQMVSSNFLQRIAASFSPHNGVTCARDQRKRGSHVPLT